MTPAARLQMAIDILQAMETTDQPLDRLLKDWFRTRRFAGSKDRAAIAERVFNVQRHRASFAWRLGSESPRSLVLASVLAAAEDPAALFTGGGYGPAELTGHELAVIAVPPTADAPLAVRGEFPAFLEAELVRAFGDGLLDEMAALTARAPVDLRVNTLRRETRRGAGRADRAGLRRGADAICAAGHPYCGRLVRARRGAMFESGAFEFQDEAAQIAALLCRARPDSRISILRRGAGGKSLALAAQMHNQGEIVACDIRQPALQELAIRARRAGATNIKTHLLGPAAPPDGLFDTVLLDAPVQRQRHMAAPAGAALAHDAGTPARARALQDRLLAQAAAHVKPGGRLVYATCSILPRENAERVAASWAAMPRSSRCGPTPPGANRRGPNRRRGWANSSAPARMRRARTASLLRFCAANSGNAWIAGHAALFRWTGWAAFSKSGHGSSRPRHRFRLAGHPALSRAGCARPGSIARSCPSTRRRRRWRLAPLPQAIILSGGPASSPRRTRLGRRRRCSSSAVPVLGICYGEMTMAEQLGGKVEGGHTREFGRADIVIARDSPLLAGLGGIGAREPVWMNHGDKITAIPQGFQVVATSDHSPYAVIADEARRLYGIQFHQEVVHTPRGAQIYRNFVLGIAGITPDWNMHAFREHEIAKIRQQVGKSKVICGLSGGCRLLGCGRADPRGDRRPAHLHLRRHRTDAQQRGRRGRLAVPRPLQHPAGAMRRRRTCS